ncbi:MAG: DMT family transporter [Gammaproteobacteria bacterium]
MRNMRHLSGNSRLAYLLLTLATLFWAGNAFVGRALHTDVPPVTFAFWRWALASCFLLSFTWRRLRADLAVLLVAWPIVLLLAILGVSCFATLLYIAAQTTTATNIALIQTAMPALIVLFGLVLFGERSSPRGVLGVTLSMLGAAVIVLHGNPMSLAQRHVVPGDAWMLLAVFLYALYSVLLRKRPAVHPLSLLTAIIVVGTLVLLPLYVWEATTQGVPQLSATLAAGTLYVAVFPSILSFLFWNRGVEIIGASRAGLFICLVPVFASAMAIAFLHEHLHIYHLVGLALIVGGFILFNHPGRAMDT